MKEMPLGLYQHYRGNLYQVIGLSRHSETLEPMVVYQALYGDYSLWVRPLELFKQTVIDHDKEVLRFTFIRPTYAKLPTLREDG